MRIFTAITIDTETKNYLLATDCSYNMACSFLEQNGLVNPTSIKPGLRFTEINFDNKTFIYDEYRGYLMEEN